MFFALDTTVVFKLYTLGKAIHFLQTCVMEKNVGFYITISQSTGPFSFQCMCSFFISVSTEFSESKENWSHWGHVYEWLLTFSNVIYCNMDWILLWTEWSKLNEEVLSVYGHHHWNFCWGSSSGIFKIQFATGFLRLCRVYQFYFCEWCRWAVILNYFSVILWK